MPSLTAADRLSSDFTVLFANILLSSSYSSATAVREIICSEFGSKSILAKTLL